MKPIIVPTDFSGMAKSALDVAIYIAQRKNHPLYLLHVIESPYTPRFSPTGDIVYEDENHQVYTLKLLEKAKSELHKLADYAKEQGLSDVKYEAKVDKVHKSVNNSIAELDAELVVIGNKRKSTDDVLGSNAEKIIRRSKAPVLTVPSELEDIEIRNIVFASDFQEATPGLTSRLSHFADIFAAQLHLVRINTPANFLSDHISKNKIQQFAQKCNLDDYTINLYSDRTEEEGIANFSKSVKADIIAMGTHGRSGLNHFFRGSIAEDVAADSMIPVLTYNLNKEEAQSGKQ